MKYGKLGIQLATVALLAAGLVGPGVHAEETSGTAAVESSSSVQVDSSSATETAASAETATGSTAVVDDYATTEASSDDSLEEATTTEAAEQTAALFQAYTGRVTGTVFGNAIAFPQALVGTWTATNTAGYTFTITINSDGSGTNVINYGQAGTTTTSFTIGSVEEVAPNLYRYVDGVNTDRINEGGIGGYGVVYDFGFSLANGTFQPVIWQTTTGASMDYTQALYGMTFAKQATSTATSTSAAATAVASSSSSVTASSASESKDRSGLPVTGEQASLLGLVGIALLALLGGVFYFNKKSKRK